MEEKLQKSFYNHKGLKIGELSDAGFFRKTVDSKKHKMKNYNAYGIDKDVIDELEKLDCKEIRIKERDTDKIYRFDFKDWLDDKKRIVADFDTLQVFLPIKHDKNNEKQN